jgi:hypothetical protein
MMDGELHLWIAKGWIALFNAKGRPLIGKYLSDGEVVDLGSKITLPGFQALVTGCILRPEVCPSPPPVKLPTSSSTWMWKISYSTSKDLDHGRFKFYDGSLHIWETQGWLVLKNAKGDPIADRFLGSDEEIHVGSKVLFPEHSVSVGTCLISPNLQAATPPASNENSALEVFSDTDSASSDGEAYDRHLAVFESISMNLDFSPGMKFRKEIKRKFGSTVHPIGKSNHFLLACSFGRAKFKLGIDIVGLALESCIGGLCDNLTVVQLSDRVFRFSVSSRFVGFMINSIRSFSCEQFKCHFHLWGNGGPNWIKEFRLWQKESNAEWTLVSPNKKRTDAAMRALRSQPARPIIQKQRVASKVKRSISFASNLSYDACAGYAAREEPSSEPSSQILPIIPFGSFDQPVRAPLLQVGAPSSISNISESGPSSVEITQQNGPPSADHGPLDGQSGLEDVINDIAYHFWECGHCLSMCHKRQSCSNRIRCRRCFRSGHIEKECLNDKTVQIWVPKKGKLHGHCLDSRVSPLLDKGVVPSSDKANTN